MRIRNFFHLIFLVFLSLQAYGMKRPALSTHSVFVPRSNTQTIQNNFLVDAKKAIEETNLLTIQNLLSTNNAILLSQEQKNELYNYAQQVQSAASSPSEIRNMLINCIYVFKFLPQLLFPQVAFTPQPYNHLTDNRQNLSEILKALIAIEQEKIYVCCFHLSLHDIAEALIEAKKRGVSIEIITTQRTKNDVDSLLFIRANLIESEIPILSPQNDPFEQMHHKFFVFKKNILNKSLVWTGSYNPTPHGNERSWDDAIILDNPEIITQYIERFEEIKKRSR